MSAAQPSVSRASAPITYGISDLCGAPANDPTHFAPPGAFYSARLGGLADGTAYGYTVRCIDSTSDGVAASGCASASGSLVAPPAPGAFPVDFLAFMDMGEPDDAEAHAPGAGWVAKGVEAVLGGGGANGDAAPAYALHVGDLSYARGYAGVWERWMDLIEPISSRVPYMVGVGNHECNWPNGTAGAFKPPWSDYGVDSGGECCVPAAARFAHMPGSAAGAAGDWARAGWGRAGLGSGGAAAPRRAALAERAERAQGITSGVAAGVAAAAASRPPYWYSFEHGGVHTFVLSTEHDWTAGSEQLAWLEADLAAVNRSATPWIVGAGHRPAYSSYDHLPGLGTQSMAAHLRKALEPLLRKHSVDVMLYGHVHAYERSCPLANFACVNASSSSGGVGSAAENSAVLGTSTGWVDVSYVAGVGGSAAMRGAASAAEDSAGVVRLGGGTVHLVVGAGGHTLTSEVTVIEQPWSAARLTHFGLGRLACANATHARWRFYRVDEPLSMGEPHVADDVWLVRGAPDGR